MLMILWVTVLLFMVAQLSQILHARFFPSMTHQLHLKPTNKLLSHSLPNASASLDTESSWLSTKSWFSLHQRCSNMCWCDVTFSLGHAFVGYSCQLFKHVTSCPVTRRWLSRCDKTLQDWIRQLRDLKCVFLYCRRSVCSENSSECL